MLISNRNKRIILFLLPAALLISCAFTFLAASNLFGNRHGYFFGFLFYWLFWCFFVPVKIIGINSVLELFILKKILFKRSIILCLFIPLLFVYLYVFPSALKQANFEIISLSLLISIVNATLEEVLWRGVYFNVFKKQKYLGIFYSSAGFAVWHYAPQIIFTSSNPGGPHSFVIFAFFLGLAYSFVVWKQQSILWVSIAHALFDFGGLGARVYLG
jgi:membrane protease YdiL (CAAX protease family)